MSEPGRFGEHMVGYSGQEEARLIVLAHPSSTALGNNREAMAKSLEESLCRRKGSRPISFSRAYVRLAERFGPNT